MSDIKKKRAPSVSTDQRAWSTVYDDINDIINSVNNKSAVESRDGTSGLDGDIRLFKDVDKTKYFIEGKFGDGWAKRELLFSDNSNDTQDESINFSATESYVKPDGTVPFTSRVIGVSPAGGNTNHLATKGYVDSNATAFELTGNVTGGTGGATAVATTIANNTISQAKMLDDSVGTAEILNSNVTYAKLQNVSATDRVLGRNSSGAGVVEEITPTQLAAIVAEASSAGGDASMFLAGTGVFREPSFSTGMHGLTDTIFQSLSDGDLLAYYSPNESTSQWRNYTRASIVRPQISSSDPISYNNSTGVISHATGAGKNHIPSGGGSGEFLKYSSSGVAVWATPSYTTNTHRDIHTSPNSSATTISISSSWAHAHDAAASAHHARYSDVEAVSAVNDTTSISTTCDSPDVNHHVQADWNQGSGSHAAYINNKPTIHYTSAVTQTELRNTLGTGDLGLVPDTGNSGEFLSYNGTWDEISVAVSVAGLSDTALVSLGTRHFLYWDGSNYWKNTLLVAGDIPNLNASKITAGTLPVSRGGTGATTGYNNSNWDTAYSDRYKWDGGSSGLTASTGRTSLGLNTGNDVQFDSFGVGTAASGTTGEIRATNEVTAYYSDDRLKNRYGNIEKALDKVCSLNGFHYQPNEIAGQLGYDTGQKKVGVSAQEVLKVLPEAVTEAPIDPQYHAVQYDKLVPLLIEAIKELNEKGCTCGSK